MLLGRINKNLNAQLKSQGKDPIFDEDPKGTSPSDIRELTFPEAEKVAPIRVPKLPPPPRVPKDIKILTEAKMYEAEHAKEIDAAIAAMPKRKVKSEAKPKAKPIPKAKVKPKARLKPMEKVKESKAKEEKDVVKKTSKIIAIEAPLELHDRMQMFMKSHPDKAKSKRQLVRFFIEQGLERHNI